LAQDYLLDAQVCEGQRKERNARSSAIMSREEQADGLGVAARNKRTLREGLEISVARRCGVTHAVLMKTPFSLKSSLCMCDLCATNHTTW
jgi:hypothetical protein